MKKAEAEPFRVTEEQIIAEAMKDVATELRLADAQALVSLIQRNQAANIADLVNSSTEMFFKCGTLQYAASAECSVQWDVAPEIRIDMEFRHARVIAAFRLVIGRRRAGVEVVHVKYDEDDLDELSQKQRLVEAIADARVAIH